MVTRITTCHRPCFRNPRLIVLFCVIIFARARLLFLRKIDFIYIYIYKSRFFMVCIFFYRNTQHTYNPKNVNAMDNRTDKIKCRELMDILGIMCNSCSLVTRLWQLFQNLANRAIGRIDSPSAKHNLFIKLSRREKRDARIIRQVPRDASLPGKMTRQKSFNAPRNFSRLNFLYGIDSGRDRK